MTTMENVLKPAKDNSADEKIRCLKARNRELVTKLRQTKLVKGQYSNISFSQGFGAEEYRHWISLTYFHISRPWIKLWND